MIHANTTTLTTSRPRRCKWMPMLQVHQSCTHVIAHEPVCSDLTTDSTGLRDGSTLATGASSVAGRASRTDDEQAETMQVNANAAGVPVLHARAHT